MQTLAGASSSDRCSLLTVRTGFGGVQKTIVGAYGQGDGRCCGDNADRPTLKLKPHHTECVPRG